jgi:hypothetical protein
MVAGGDIFFGLDKHTLSTIGDSAFLEEGAFRFFYDTRFTEGLNAPGVPQLRSRTLFIINTTWREENVL